MKAGASAFVRNVMISRFPTFALGVCAVLAALHAPAAAQERTLLEKNTAHYALKAWATSDELRTWSELLEQTWPEIEDALRATPKLDANEKLAFRIDADKEACLKATLDDKQSMPKSADPAWFSPYNRGVYMYRQPSAVFTRMMVIYAAVLQYHALCKGKNIDLDTTWFVHGLAQTLSVHRWDGVKVELGVSPRLCVVDYPARALEALGGPGFELDTKDEERIANPYASWSAVRFALYGAGGKLRAKFQKLALGYSGSKLSGKEFLRELGFDRNTRKDFREWLLAEQYPFAIEQGDWEEKLDRSLVGGRELPSDLSVAVLRAPRSALRGMVHGLTEHNATRALILSWTDARNFALGRLEPPMLIVDYHRDGKIVDSARYPLPNPAADALEFEMRQLEIKASPGKKQLNWRPAGVSLVIDGKDLGRIDVMEGQIGLASYAGLSRFSKIVLP